MNEDDDIWRDYAKSVKPIGREKKEPAALNKKSEKLNPSPAKTRGLQSKPKFSLPLPSAYAKASADKQGERESRSIQATFSRTNERDLRSGDIEIEVRIDLHGMRENEAYESLMHFIARQIKAGKRHLLIITGKGSGGSGLLKASLPYWLAHSPYAASILDIRAAAPKHGGTGAFYVMMRRRRG